MPSSLNPIHYFFSVMRVGGEEKVIFFKKTASTGAVKKYLCRGGALWTMSV
jgi:hypothetical protein